MRRISLFLSMVVSISLFAQKNDQIILSVRYSFSHMTDTTMPEKRYKENMLLQVANSKSVYLSADKAEADSARNAITQNALKNAADGGKINIDMRGVKRANNDMIYKELSAPLKTTKLFNKVYYLIEEPPITFDWKISTETKNINGLNCQKATTNFRGRTYEAWFCADLPYQTGPWKLSGLPGLIVEAYDTKRHVEFLLTSVEDKTKDKLTILLPEPIQKTTTKEFEQMRQSYLTALTGGQNGSLSFKVTNSPAGGSTIPKMNNPIELTNQ